MFLFAAAFGGVFAYGWYNAPTPEEAAIEAQFKDAVVAELGQRPEPETAPSSGTDLMGAYRDLQGAYRKMNTTCTTDARKTYAAAFANYIETAERATEAGIDVDDGDIDQMGTMNQFLDVAARHVIEASDMPSRRFRRMVAAVAFH